MREARGRRAPRAHPPARASRCASSAPRRRRGGSSGAARRPRSGTWWTCSRGLRSRARPSASASSTTGARCSPSPRSPTPASVSCRCSGARAPRTSCRSRRRRAATHSRASLPRRARRSPARAWCGRTGPSAPGGFASWGLIGQILDGYPLREGEGRVVLMDKHAAHERVVFERLRAECRAGGIARDRLLVPETIALPAAESALLAEHAAALAAAGLEGEPFGEGTFLLRTVPGLLRGRDVGALVRAVAGELVEEGASAAAERAPHAALATIACHGVVRVGQRLGAAEAPGLLASMDGVEVSAHCPHGRPVAAELARTQLEALFRR